MEVQVQRLKGKLVVTHDVIDLNPPTAENLMVERLKDKNGFVERIKPPITITSYNIASPQRATNRFNHEFLIGEGSLDRVYKAEFPDVKEMAIKETNTTACDRLKQPKHAMHIWAKMKYSKIPPTIIKYELLFLLDGHVNALYRIQNMLLEVYVDKKNNCY